MRACARSATSGARRGADTASTIASASAAGPVAILTIMKRARFLCVGRAILEFVVHLGTQW
jgi:hypothetical protein